MGQKANLLDPESLETLYTESIRYKNKADELSHHIRIRMNQLTDPLYLNHFKNGQSNTFVHAIIGGKQALEDLLDAVKDTANFIDSTLENTKSPWDNHQPSDKIKESQTNQTLKR
ncbi:hypothetical protein HZI73_23675 [Vallitalea pronyensis]|uniref:Uncharacterized protein n=1 Tax=Vallitalea pronyensis TaxID=1348613 RepID=A0A8J8MP26_9FIRM|nr:hypothetical protein [Vallitalea pronyensis]QUI25111.1 hypothetical protein HZI73_23675 [Vallitalea pronyensis]